MIGQSAGFSESANSQLESASVDILVVDDTPENLRLLSALLLQKNYKVRKALSGKMALTAVETLMPDLILLDVRMPEMDGYRVCQQLKAKPRTAAIPVIFLSALDEALDKVKAFQVGGADYITKPFQLEEVMARIQHQLALKAAEKTIQQLQATRDSRVQTLDPLTGLANRDALLACLDQALGQLKQQPEYQFAVLLLSSDRLPQLDHALGDRLLEAMSQKLSTLLNPNDLLFRCDDVFAIFLDQATPAAVTQLAEQILAAFAVPLAAGDYALGLEVRMGLVQGHARYDRSAHLLRDAYTALDRARPKKTAWDWFEPQQQITVPRLQLETDLHRAAAAKFAEFVVYYQPIVALETGQVAGCEALIHWHHPHRGVILPSEFMAVAEIAGLRAQIEQQAFLQVCRQLGQWQRQNIADRAFTVSLDCSKQRLLQPNLIAQIDQVFAETELLPHTLKLEVGEAAFWNDASIASLQTLKHRQILLTLDHFGTGYASLSWQHFAIDTLKIDQSWIRPLDQNSENWGLVPTIINFAQTMNINVVAEGVETTSQCMQLKQLNCNFGQGSLFSAAVPAEQITHLLSNPQGGLCL